MKDRNKWNKKYYAGKGLWFGVACLFFAFYFFAPSLFTFKSSLIERRGDIDVVEANYTRVSGSRGHESIKAELILKLKNDRRNYKLNKNIGSNRRNDKFELISDALKKSEEASVWIKKSEQSDFEPKVYQIATGKNEILYDMDDAKSELKFIFPLFVVMGIFGIGIYINHKYPDQFKKLYRK